MPLFRGLKSPRLVSSAAPAVRLEERRARSKLRTMCPNLMGSEKGDLGAHLGLAQLASLGGGQIRKPPPKLSEARFGNLELDEFPILEVLREVCPFPSAKYHPRKCVRWLTLLIYIYMVG